MKRDSTERGALMDELLLGGRRVGAAAVMFHAAASAALGISPTEEKALDLLDRNGAMTHADLVEATNLAPASVTGLIKRLETRGYVRRLPNPSDRRSILIEAVPERMGELAPIFADWGATIGRLSESYSDAELRLIIRYLNEAASAQEQATLRVTDEFGTAQTRTT